MVVNFVHNFDQGGKTTPIIKPSVTGAGEVTEITLVIKPLVTTEGVERVHGNLILKQNGFINCYTTDPLSESGMGALKPYSLQRWPQLGLQQTKNSVIPSSPLEVACMSYAQNLWY